MNNSIVRPGEQVVLFDGVCRLCSFWARFLTRYDKSFLFKLAPVQSPEGQQILQHLGMPTEDYQTMVLVTDNQTYTHSTAFLKVIQQLSPPWSLLVIGYLVPRVIRDWLYVKIANNRYRLFGRYQACMVPDENMSKRLYKCSANQSDRS